MSKKLNPVLAAFQNRPACIAEDQAPFFEACMAKVSEKLDIFEAHTETYVASEDTFWDCGEDSFLSMVRPYRVVDGILTIPVRGILKHRFPFQFGSWATGYAYIWEAVKRGVEDSNVKGIALHVDSPGGAVPDLFDLCDKLVKLRGTKPIKAFVAENAASAAYCVASCADDITVTRTGNVGSIGVIGVHSEMSKRLKAEGITVTFIRSKPFKGEGGTKEPLRPETEARLQAEVDELHDQFVAIVARNRSMDAAAVDATEAVTFMGEHGVKAGLADAVAPFEDALTAFVASMNQGDGYMATDPKADQTAAIAAAKAEGITEGKAAGAADERARFNAILASDAGKARPKAALAAALKMSGSVEEVTSFLAELPEETAPQAAAPAAPVAPEAPKGAGAPAGMLEAAMNGTENPNLGAATEDDDKDPDAELMSLIGSAGLSGFKAAKQ